MERVTDITDDAGGTSFRPTQKARLDSLFDSDNEDLAIILTTPTKLTNRKRKASTEAWEQDTNVRGIIDEANVNAPTRLIKRARQCSDIEKISSKTLADQIEAEEQRKVEKELCAERRNAGKTKTQVGSQVETEAIIQAENLKFAVENKNGEEAGPPTELLKKERKELELMDQFSELTNTQKKELDELETDISLSKMSKEESDGWWSREMLGLSHPSLEELRKEKFGEKKIEPYVLGTRKIWPRPEPLSLFFPERVLPKALWGKLPCQRINIPMTERNKDTSQIRNPLKNTRRTLTEQLEYAKVKAERQKKEVQKMKVRAAEEKAKAEWDRKRGGGKRSTRYFKSDRDEAFGVNRIPSHLFSTPNAVSARLEVAKLENEIREARERGERHPQESDTEYRCGEGLENESNKEGVV